MKKLDKLLLTSFIPPFVVTFFIALFVLIMQTLWIYIDDIIGKGVGFWMILEFIFYRSISLFPMALPIAVLLSSVMIMGDLAERYELASMKSAGVSLVRIMQPLVFACIGIAFFSWISSNYFIPRANLKFKSRLYDMRKQKPTLNLEEGVFNDDFDGYRIRIGEKAGDDRGIKNVFIANHEGSQKDKLNEIVAEEGEMYTTGNERYMIMELKNGEQFQEGNRYVSGSKNKAPFVRTSFKKYTKIFDMNEFDINRTDEELFKNHYSMLSMGQLREAIDSISVQLENRKTILGEYVDNYFTVLNKKKSVHTIAWIEDDSIPADMVEYVKDDSVKLVRKKEKKKANWVNKKLITEQTVLAIKRERTKKDTSFKKVFNKPPILLKDKQNITKDLKEYSSILETFPKYKHKPYLDKANQVSRNIKSNSDSAKNFVEKTKEKKVKHIFELYSKYSFAVVCIVFLFIGAPMGAIVRKGGFGYPLLFAIICFMLFIVLTMAFKDMAEAFVIHPVLAVWMPNLILAPIGVILTYKAMNDSKFINTGRIDKIVSFFKRLLVKRSV